MLLSEKMKQTDFSNAESALVEFILAKGTAIEPLTIKEIAEANYVHPSTLIRVAKKLGYKGWLDHRSDRRCRQQVQCRWESAPRSPSHDWRP